MKKTLKIVGIAIGAIFALALILALTLPLWIGCIVRPVANTAVPQLTRTDFNLGGFSFNLYNGRLEISGVKLANPKEFDQEMAFTLGKVFVDVDMSTIFSDPIVIEKIEVKDVFVSYLDGSHGTNNFDVITANVKDTLGIEDEPDDDDKPKAETATEVKPETAKVAPDADEDEKGGSGRKFIIDDLLIDSVVVQYGAVTLPLKVPIHLTGIGRDLGGLNAENAWKEIFSQFWRSITDIGAGIMNLGSKALDSASDLVNGSKIKEGTGAAMKTTSEAVDKAAGAIKGLFK